MGLYMTFTSRDIYDIYMCLQMYLQVFTSGRVQTQNWLPSSPKWDIFGIMANVLSLMETYLINMSTLW